MGGYGNMVESGMKGAGGGARAFYTRYGRLSAIFVHEGR